jgi:hypothetical protein
MLNDFGDKSLVSSTDLSCKSFGQVGESSDHPVLIKHTNAVAMWFSVILDHAEFTMNRPEDEEDDEHVMGVPETFKVSFARLLR